MPILDDERGVLVLRVVYDGPPLSGKTTTLRSLSERLGASVVTPEERDGRTLWFDWLDYVGGLYEGRQIRCQVVSVPGQKLFAERRRVLLESADAVVLVADTTPEPFDAALAILEELVPFCRDRRPATGIVMQANKRDDPDALPREEVRARLDAIAPVALSETVATAGTGVREAFVFAVRLALDRVRALMDAGELAHGRPEIDDADALLAAMQAQASLAAPAPARDADEVAGVGQDAEPTEPAVAEEHSAEVPAGAEENDSEEEVPFRPDPMMPGGFIWPPVDGRTLLHEVAQLDLRPERGARGDWSAIGGGWRCHSHASDIYPGLDEGRAALIAWARRHAASGREISPGRVLLLADAGGERMRLWQLVRIEPGLREQLETRIFQATARDAADALLLAANQLLRARFAHQAANLDLPLTLWAIGADAMLHPCFVGLMPSEAAPPKKRTPPDELLEREFRSVVRALRRDHPDFAGVRAQLESRSTTDEAARVLAELARAGDAAAASGP